MTTGDDRKAEDDWLLAREAVADDGTAPAPPSDEAGRIYDALAAEIAALPTVPAPAGWRDRMLAALDEPARAAPPSPPRRRRWWLVAAPLAAAAVALLAWLFYGPGPRPEPIALHVEVRAGDAVRRAGEAPAVGDLFVARVLLAGAGELRLYRNDSALVVRCPGHRACRVKRVGVRDEHSFEVPMTSKGEYRALVIDGAIGLALTGSLDSDAQAARAQGARVTASRAVGAR